MHFGSQFAKNEQQGLYQVAGVSVLVIVFLLSDYLRNRRSARDVEREHIETVLTGSPEEQSKEQRKLQRYIR